MNKKKQHANHYSKVLPNLIRIYSRKDNNTISNKNNKIITIPIVDDIIPVVIIMIFALLII